MKPAKSGSIGNMTEGAEKPSKPRGTEQRRFVRVDDNFKATITFVDRGLDDLGRPPIGTAWSRNLSLGGFAFVADTAAALGEQVAVSLEVAEIESGIQFIGEVVRSAPCVGRPGAYEISLRFLPTGIDEATRLKVEELVYRRTSR